MAGSMFLKESTRFKDGKEHHYWSMVENRRVDGGRKVVQRHVLYLGEINSTTGSLAQNHRSIRDGLAAAPNGSFVSAGPGSARRGRADRPHLPG